MLRSCVVLLAVSAVVPASAASGVLPASSVVAETGSLVSCFSSLTLSGFLPACSTAFRLVQWNLLATGMHKDGFVKGSEVSEQFLELARVFKGYITSKTASELVNHVVGENEDGSASKTNFEWFTAMQGFLIKLVFSDAFVETGAGVCAGLQSAGLEGLAAERVFFHQPEEEKGLLFDEKALRKLAEKGIVPNNAKKPVADVAAVEVGASAFAGLFDGIKRDAFVKAFTETMDDLLKNHLIYSMKTEAKKKGRVFPTKYNPLKYVFEGLRLYRDAFCTGDQDPEPTFLNNLRASYKENMASDDPVNRNKRTVAVLDTWKPDIFTAQEIAPDQYVAISKYMARGDPSTVLPVLPVLPIEEVADVPEDFKTGANWMATRPVVWKRTGPVVIGSGVFVNPEKFKIVHAERVFEDLGVLVKVAPKVASLFTKSPAPFCVFSGHLKSGNNEDKDGAKRFTQLQRFQQTVADSDACRGLELIIGMDGNYDRTLGATYVDTKKTDHELQLIARQQGRQLTDHELAWIYWNQHLPTSPAKKIWDGSYFQSYLELADLGPDELLVSVNKMRGLSSEQVKKWGEYQLRNIDYVFLKKVAGLDGGLAMKQFVNLENLQRYPVAVLQKLTEESTIEDILKVLKDHPEIMQKLMPNADEPSDHSPIVMEFIVEANNKFGAS